MLPSTAAEHALGAGGARGPLLFAPRPSPGPSTESRLKLSIAELTEQQATKPGVTVTYVSSYHQRAEADKARPTAKARGFGHVARQMRRVLRVTGPSWERGTWKGDKWTPAVNESIPASVWRSHNQSMESGMRCGFNWDDAAAKANMQTCKTDMDCVFRQCYKDLPDYQRSPQGDCISRNPYVMSDLHCQLMCGATLLEMCTKNCEP